MRLERWIAAVVGGPCNVSAETGAIAGVEGGALRANSWRGKVVFRIAGAWRRGYFTRMEITSTQSTQQNVDREVVQASLVKKALVAEMSQKVQILQSTQLPPEVEQDTSVVGRYINVKA